MRNATSEYIAQKYKLTEEKVKSLIKDINHFLTTH
jgi:hypothetical protein